MTRLRHAAALALVGWYLMVPPSHHLLAPIADWAHFDSYDSATECRDAQMDLMIKSKDPDSKMHRMMEAIAASECIASDDPRLKEK